MNPIGMSKPSANSIPPRPQKPLGPLIIIKPVKVIISRDKLKYLKKQSTNETDYNEGD